MENLNKEHNVDAVKRTCEAFGVQHIHIVPEPGEGGILSDITLGCHQWLTVRYHETIEKCFQTLRQDGFQLFAGALSEKALPLRDVDFSGKVALVFSNELHGATPEVLNGVDGQFIIPLYGFTQSLNVSVAAGIALHHIRLLKEAQAGGPSSLSGEECESLMEKWTRSSVKHADAILSELKERE